MRMFVTGHVFCWFFSPGAPCWGASHRTCSSWNHSAGCRAQYVFSTDFFFFPTVELRMICSSTLHAIQVRETGLIIVWWIVVLSFLADWWEKCIPPVSWCIPSVILSVFLNIDQTLKKGQGYWKVSWTGKAQQDMPSWKALRLLNISNVACETSLSHTHTHAHGHAQPWDQFAETPDRIRKNKDRFIGEKSPETTAGITFLIMQMSGTDAACLTANCWRSCAVLAFSTEPSR